MRVPVRSPAVGGRLPPRRRDPRGRDRGFVAVLVCVCMAACVLLCLMAEATVAAAGTARRSEQARAAYVAEAALRLAQWYGDNTALLDSSGARIPAEDELLRAAGIVPRHGVRVSVGPSLDAGTGRYRPIAVWLPAGPSVDAVWRDGRFDPAVATHHSVVDGRAVHAALRDRTLETMRRFALALEARARALVLRDSDRRADVNHFRPADPGCAAVRGELPCLDRYVPAAAIDWADHTGTDVSGLSTAWGGPIEVSNKVDANADRPPFTLALRAVAPWGETLRMVATQPIE
jgi:hypothetical protein